MVLVVLLYQGVIMSKCKLLMVLFFISSLSFGQVFIPVDKDTNEFIDKVDFSLFKKKRVVYKGVTLSDQVTKMDQGIEFDSISFSKVDYEVLGLLKGDVDSVVSLSKKIIYLDELVIGSQVGKEVVLGETNRFVKSQSRPINSELVYGCVFRNNFQEKLRLDKIAFYVENIVFKTAYRVNFIEIHESIPKGGSQFAERRELVFSSDTLYLNRKDKKVVVDLPSELYLLPSKAVFVWLELLGYYDKDGKVYSPAVKDRSKLKFQLSSQTQFYSKMSDFFTKELSPELFNVNVMINYDFANRFFKKPHKSILVTPAILLYGKKSDE